MRSKNLHGQQEIERNKLVDHIACVTQQNEWNLDQYTPEHSHDRMFPWSELAVGRNDDYIIAL